LKLEVQQIVIKNKNQLFVFFSSFFFFDSHFNQFLETQAPLMLTAGHQLMFLCSSQLMANVAPSANVLAKIVKLSEIPEGKNVVVK
jgi:hypothetical protein